MNCIDHVNIVVQNLPLMADFYSNLLGLTITKRVTIQGAWVDQTVGLKHALADVIYLDLPSGPRLELIAYRNPPACRTEGLSQSNTPGLRHLAFSVSNIEQLVAHLRAHGIAFLSDVQRVPVEQVSYGGDVQKHIVYFHDPEGNLLELCEYKRRQSS